MLDPVIIRERLKVSPDRDAEIQFIINAVIGQFERATNRLWLSRTNYTHLWELRQFDKNRTYLYSPLYPITSFSLQERLITQTDADYTIVDPGDYYVDFNTGTITRRRWSFWLDLELATISGGYDKTTVPPEVSYALETQVKFLFSRNGNQRIDIDEQSIKGSTAKLMSADFHPTFVQACMGLRKHTSSGPLA